MDDFIKTLDDLSCLKITQNNIKDFIDIQSDIVKYIINIRLGIEYQLSAEERFKHKISRFKPFKKHKIYCPHMIMIGHQLNKKHIAISNISMDEALHSITIMYLYSANRLTLKCLGLAGNIPKLLYLTLCVMAYNFMPFECYMKEFAMGVTSDSFISNLQCMYTKTNDMRYIYAINMILRYDSYNYKYMIENIQDRYKYKVSIPNYMNFKYFSKPITSSDPLDQIYSKLHGIYTDIYKPIIQGLIENREIDLKKLHRAIMKGSLKEHEKGIAYIIHMANILYYMTNGATTIN